MKTFKNATERQIKKFKEFNTVDGSLFAGLTHKGTAALPSDSNWVFEGKLIPAGNGSVTMNSRTLNQATGEIIQ